VSKGPSIGNNFETIFAQMTSSAQVITFRVKHYVGIKICFSQYGVYEYQTTQFLTQIQKI
jgi:hypothetical protein